MEKLGIWLFVVLAVAVALFGNYLGATWASKPEKISLYLLAVVIVSPFVFITFGLVTSRMGVAIGSGTIDALLTVCTILMGLLFFQEWNKISMFQYIGLAMILSGIAFLHFS